MYLSPDYGSSWSHLHTLTSPSDTEWRYFGRAVAIRQNDIFVGSESDNKGVALLQCLRVLLSKFDNNAMKMYRCSFSILLVGLQTDMEPD